MHRSDIPKAGALINRPGKGNNKGFTHALRQVKRGGYAVIKASPGTAGALACKLWGVGNYAVRSIHRGCRVYWLSEPEAPLGKDA
jgi:hypothetical protein